MNSRETASSEMEEGWVESRGRWMPEFRIRQVRSGWVEIILVGNIVVVVDDITTKIAMSAGGRNRARVNVERTSRQTPR